MTQRPNCDVCEIQKASFYCEADEAYLCQECDASVHGANTLASRHKRVTFKQEQMDGDGGDQEENVEENDGVCPGLNFACSARLSTSALDFPLGAVRIGDITFARIGGGGGGGGGGGSVSSIAPGRRDDDEPHEVPRFVPVAQELPSLEPFRFHALATNGRSAPVQSAQFMSLLEGDAIDADDIIEQEEDGAQELGVVPNLVHPRVAEQVAAKAVEACPKGPRLDKEREARVNRYREKRRTRMFSKKIRYEVRKIYAENRPRLKGRFVRRSNDIEQCL